MEAASRPISKAGCVMVVKDGFKKTTVCKLEKLMTLISFGIYRVCRLIFNLTLVLSFCLNCINLTLQGKMAKPQNNNQKLVNKV